MRETTKMRETNGYDDTLRDNREKEDGEKEGQSEIYKKIQLKTIQQKTKKYKAV